MAEVQNGVSMGTIDLLRWQLDNLVAKRRDLQREVARLEQEMVVCLKMSEAMDLFSQLLVVRPRLYEAQAEEAILRMKVTRLLNIFHYGDLHD